MTDSASLRRVSVVLFEGFELLDVCGPLEILGRLPEHFAIELIGPEVGLIASTQGPALLASERFERASSPDIVLVPGGQGTRALAENQPFFTWLAGWAEDAALVTSVCTGSALLAAAGLLDGYRATSNKRAFDWARRQGPRVEWVAAARWVEDRNRWTSSGIAAGMDMALGLLASLHSPELAQSVADQIELEWHADPTWDPFATKAGLLDTGGESH